MEFTVNRQTLEAERLAGSGEAQLLLRAEALVSGAGRENVEILMTDASALLGSVEVQPERVVLDGTVRCQAAYRLGGESIARALHAQTTMSHVFDVKGAHARMFAQARATVDDVKAKYENGHMVFDVSVTLGARVMELSPVDVITGVSDGPCVETDAREITSMKLSAENTITALVSENVPLPAALDARTALMEWAVVSDVDARRDLGGVRVTGNVLCEALISSGVATRPVALVRYTLPLDQLVEMPDWLAGDVRASARVRSVSTDVEQAIGGEDSALRMEAEIDVGVSAIGTERVSALCDAYSTGDEDVAVTPRQFEVCTGIHRVCVSEPFRGTLLLPEGAGAVGSVCAVRARANVGEVSAGGGKTAVSGVVDAQVLYMSGSGDRLMRAGADLPFEITLATQVNEGAWVEVNVLSCEGNALMSDRVEMKCMLSICVDQRESERVEAADEIARTGQAARAHGVMLIWPQTGDSAWSIGKKYRVPLRRVAQAADGEAIAAGRAIVMQT